MHVFVYGTLTDPDRASAVLGTEADFVGEARLDGLHRVEGGYPTLAPGGDVEGRLLRTDRVRELDIYEGVDVGLYVRVSVPRTDGGEAAVYVGNAARLGVPTPVEWPGDGSLRERVERYVRESAVAVEPLE